MARGYPDFFGHSVFPYYGPTVEIGGNAIVLATGVRTPCYTLSVKGLIREIQLWLTSADFTTTSAIFCSIDGSDVTAWQIDNLIDHRSGIGGNDDLRIFSWLNGGNLIGMELIEDIPFGYEFRIDYRNDSALPDTVAWYIRYAQTI